MARLMGAGDLMVEYDQRYEHYGVPQPQLLALQLLQTPSGLSDPVSFGTPRPNMSVVSTLDEQDLSAPATIAWPSPVVTYTVNDPRPWCAASRTRERCSSRATPSGSTISPGSACSTRQCPLLLRDAGHGPEPHEEPGRTGGPTRVTDTNRKQAFRWNTLNANTGDTETPDEDPAKTDLSDSPIELFPGTSIDQQDVRHLRRRRQRDGEQLRQPGLVHAREPRPTARSTTTSTRRGTPARSCRPAGQWWQVQLSNPVTTDHITLVQVQRGTARA